MLAHKVGKKGNDHKYAPTLFQLKVSKKFSTPAYTTCFQTVTVWCHPKRAHSFTFQIVRTLVKPKKYKHKIQFYK